MEMEPNNHAFSASDEVEDPLLSRRRLLRRMTGVVVTGSILSGAVGCTIAANPTLSALYPDLTGVFGSRMDLGDKRQFPTALPDECKLNTAGVFYNAPARAFIVHLDKDTSFLLKGNALLYQLGEDAFVRDTDGSYWGALYQRCVHLGTTVTFHNECSSFKCPSHGAHYACDGEYLDGPAPRSMDRFQIFFQYGHLLVDTGTLLHVPRTDTTTRLLAPPSVQCSASY